MRKREFIAKLREARKLLACGWQRGYWMNEVNGQTCFCIGGALRYVGLAGEFEVELPDGQVGDIFLLADWNDRRERTQADVLACIDNSIAALERETPSSDRVTK